ncbi:carboxylesterase [Calderihabitans maritimus]|uniref:Carboxylesterase, partial n=1 Tax=Calderihabitans maritimus TaxID=1246530 RepID=A0A1Z5HPT6_9FIRM|nr:carboxylesterase [Calderihabitans maritimus]
MPELDKLCEKYKTRRIFIKEWVDFNYYGKLSPIRDDVWGVLE